MSRQLKPAYKVVLSGLILFHLLAIFVLPNPDSILYRALSPIVTYGNFFGFNTTWRFFSPNPLVRVLEYEVFTPDDSGQLRSEVLRYPRSLEAERFREIYNRKMNNAMYMLMKPEFTQEILGPRLCAMHPGAESLGISMKGRVQATIENSRLQGDRRESIGEVQTQYVGDVHCRKEEAP